MWEHDATEQAFRNGYEKGYEAGKEDSYTEEQVASIIRLADKVDRRNRELEKELAWLKSCLNCKIRKECSGHCGKVVHNCDHWEYGDNAVEVVHGRRECEHETWGRLQCSNCKKEALLEKSNGDVGTSLLYVTSNYCPNCGAKMDLED